jgi:hypothetical protein
MACLFLVAACAGVRQAGQSAGNPGVIARSDTYVLVPNGGEEYHFLSPVYEEEGISWNFSSTGAMIEVLACNSSDFTGFYDGNHSEYYAMLSNVSYAGSGTFDVPYTDLWYIVFYNPPGTANATVTCGIWLDSISLVSPSTGGTYAAGGTMPIAWTSQGITTVYIELQSGARTWAVGTELSIGDESINYSIPSNVPAGTYQVFIYDSVDFNVFAISGTFTITASLTSTLAIIIPIVVAIVVAGAVAGIAVVVHRKNAKKKEDAIQPGPFQQAPGQGTNPLLPPVAGWKLPEAVRKPAFCPACGTKLEAGANFCAVCGFKV